MHVYNQLKQDPKYSNYRQSLREYKEKTEAKIMSDCEYIIELVQTNVLTK